jgi:hypothetical protein
MFNLIFPPGYFSQEVILTKFWRRFLNEAAIQFGEDF